MPKIETIIAKDGSVTVKTEGFVGKACQDATKQLEQALGVVAKETKNPEFYASADARASQQ
jgi:hypothetical protein